MYTPKGVGSSLGSRRMYTPKGSWVLPGEAPNSPSANTHVLPTHLFLCRLAVNAFARLHAPCACAVCARCPRCARGGKTPLH